MPDTNTTIDVAVRGSQSARATILASIANNDASFMADLDSTIKAGDIVKTSPVIVLADLQRIAANNPDRFDLDSFPRVNSTQKDGGNNWDLFNDGVDDTSMCDAFAMSLLPALRLMQAKDMLEKYLAQDCVAHVGMLPTGDEWPELSDKYATESLIGTIKGRISTHKGQIRQAIQLYQTLEKFADKLPNINLSLPDNGKAYSDPAFKYTTSTLPIEVSDPNKRGAYKPVAAKAFLRWGAISRDKDGNILPDVIDKTVAAGGTYIDLVKMLQREKPPEVKPPEGNEKRNLRFNPITPDDTMTGVYAILTQYNHHDSAFDNEALNKLVAVLSKPSATEERISIEALQTFTEVVMARLERVYAEDKKTRAALAQAQRKSAVA